MLAAILLATVVHVGEFSGRIAGYCYAPSYCCVEPVPRATFVGHLPRVESKWAVDADFDNRDSDAGELDEGWQAGFVSGQLWWLDVEATRRCTE